MAKESAVPPTLKGEEEGGEAIVVDREGGQNAEGRPSPDSQEKPPSSTQHDQGTFQTALQQQGDPTSLDICGSGDLSPSCIIASEDGNLPLLSVSNQSSSSSASNLSPSASASNQSLPTSTSSLSPSMSVSNQSTSSSTINQSPPTSTSSLSPSMSVSNQSTSSSSISQSPPTSTSSLSPSVSVSNQSTVSTASNPSPSTSAVTLLSENVPKSDPLPSDALLPPDLNLSPPPPLMDGDCSVGGSSNNGSGGGFGISGVSACSVGVVSGSSSSGVVVVAAAAAARKLQKADSGIEVESKSPSVSVREILSDADGGDSVSDCYACDSTGLSHSESFRSDDDDDDDDDCHDVMGDMTVAVAESLVVSNNSGSGVDIVSSDASSISLASPETEDSVKEKGGEEEMEEQGEWLGERVDTSVRKEGSLTSVSAMESSLRLDDIDISVSLASPEANDSVREQGELVREKQGQEEFHGEQIEHGETVDLSMGEDVSMPASLSASMKRETGDLSLQQGEQQEQGEIVGELKGEKQGERLEARVGEEDSFSAMLSPDADKAVRERGGDLLSEEGEEKGEKTEGESKREEEEDPSSALLSAPDGPESRLLLADDEDEISTDADTTLGEIHSMRNSGREEEEEEEREEELNETQDKKDEDQEEKEEEELELESNPNPWPRHNWRVVPELRAREIGVTGCTPPALFRERVQGSLYMVQRLKLQYRMEHHQGCVNSLHFNRIGTLLASGADDLQIVLWNWARNRKALVYDSGHRSNVFQAKFMPYSGDCHVISCARDGQVRLSELSLTGVCKNTKKLAQHKGAAHKLALEYDSPHVFLSCGEDAVVYQVDLREEKPHKLAVTKEGDNKIPLYSIHSNPVNPYHFLTSGRDPYVRIYDKRKINGSVDNGIIKKYCPKHLDSGTPKTNVTCASYSYNGSEIVGSYNDEDIYVFDNLSDSTDAIHRYRGHRNNATVKGVSFYGPRSEYVVTGSDCGHVFIWDKVTEHVVQFLEADRGGVVNVLEPHPFAPVLATSGLDHDVKIFSPISHDPPRLEGLEMQKRKNHRDRRLDSQCGQEPDMIDGQMLWFIMNHFRRSARRRLREGGEDVSSSSNSSDSDDDDDGDDDDDDHDGMAERMQCQTS